MLMSLLREFGFDYCFISGVIRCSFNYSLVVKYLVICSIIHLLIFHDLMVELSLLECIRYLCSFNMAFISGFSHMYACVMKNSSSKLILCLQIWSIVQQYVYYICIISNGVKLELNLLLTSMLTSVNIFTNLVLFMAIAPCNLACIFMYIESGVSIP